MSGHSKWSTIKRKKGAADARRGAVFTRLARELAIAAREAKSENMPKDNIERAIRRGTGEDKESADFEEIMYEGYGPKGVAFMIETVTDNRNRSVSDIRHALTKSGGSMGEVGSVAWQFDRLAYFAFPSSELDYDKSFELAVEAGADDVSEEEGMIEITGPVDTFKAIADLLHKAKVSPEEAGLRMVPKQEVELDISDTLQVMRVIEGLEEMDDVQNVYSNLKVSEEALAELETA